MVPNTTDIISRHHPLSQPTQIQQLKLVGITHFQDNIIGNHFKLTPFFTDNKLLLWTQHYMLTDCGRKCRFIETYFIAKDMFTPLVARQRFQTIQKAKKYQLELFFFSNEIHVVLSLDNCRTVLSGLLKVPRTET